MDEEQFKKITDWLHRIHTAIVLSSGEGWMSEKQFEELQAKLRSIFGALFACAIFLAMILWTVGFIFLRMTK